MTRHGGLGCAMLLGAVMLWSAGRVATRDWVRTQIARDNAPIQSKVAQLERAVAQGRTDLEQVNSRVTQVDGRVTQVDGRVGQVDGRLTQVATQTTEARMVANEGVQKAAAVDERLTRTLASRYSRELVETVTLLFAPGKSKLLPVHEDALRGVLKTLLENPTYTADIVGFTDATGPQRYNLTLSWLREEAARRYLSQRTHMLNRLTFIGLGEEMTGGDKSQLVRAEDRQVAILIYRPVM